MTSNSRQLPVCWNSSTKLSVKSQAFFRIRVSIPYNNYSQKRAMRGMKSKSPGPERARWKSPKMGGEEGIRHEKEAVAVQSRRTIFALAAQDLRSSEWESGSGLGS
jgi:hypothetical protein